MVETLLRTKLFIPPLRPNLITRPHLIRHLNQGLQLGQKLTLLSAPAGFGKTTLLSTWIQEAGLSAHVGWLSLDEGDNNLKRFLAYIVAALQNINREIGKGLIATLQSGDAVNIEFVLITLLNEVSDHLEDVILLINHLPPVTSKLHTMTRHPKTTL